MIILKEDVEINAPFEKLLSWVDNFEEEFVKWSPDHFECKLIDGGINVGDRVSFHEIVMGVDYNVSGTIIQSMRDKDHFLFEFMSDAKSATIIFEGKRTENGCHFYHTESFGSRLPIIGGLLNFVIFKILYKKKANWQLIKDDMILDNKYLKDILENATYPERTTKENI